MKKICMVAYTDYVSDTRCKYEAEALANNGDSVDFFSILNDESQKDFEQINGVNVYRLKIVRYFGGNKFNYLFSYLIFFFKIFFKISFFHFEKDYDCIHINNIPDFLVFSALIPKVSGSKIILDLHDSMPNTFTAKFDVPKEHWLIRLITFQTILCCKFADLVITVHEPIKEEFVSYGIPAKKIKCILNCATQEVFHFLPKTRTDNSFQLVYHGAIAERLGIDLLAIAVKKLSPQIPELKLVVYGGGEFVDGLSQMIKDLEIEKFVEFHPGYIPYEKLPPIIAEADLGIVPTKEEKGSELMLPVKLLEYAAMHKAIVCSKIYTVTKYFDDKMLLFFEPQNADDLAEKILYLYKNKAERERYSLGVQKFNEEFSGEKEKEKYRQMVYELIGN